MLAENKTSLQRTFTQQKTQKKTLQTTQEKRQKRLQTLLILFFIVSASLIVSEYAWSSDVTHAAEIADATEAPIHKPAPIMGPSDYRQMGKMSSRSFVWVIAQLHLFLAAFVLAVPLFVTVIEWIGVKTGDQRYDHMAHEFMKVSMTAYH